VDSTFTLKIILVPAIIGAASLAGRRWGPAVSGWLVGLPFTSAPIIFFLALSHGPAFAADSAMGTLAGGLSLSGFCVAYHLLAPRFRWPVPTAVALIVLVAANMGLQYLRIPLWALTLAVLAALGGSSWLIASGRGPASADEPPPLALPAWDIPARMLAATAFVVLITAIAPLIGPRMSGLVATFPLVAGTVTIFTHAQRGARAASGVLSGLLMGLFAFTGFYLVLISMLTLPQRGLVPAGIGPAFGAGILAALLVEGGTLWLMQRLQ
jgi:hypothetical protein